MSDETVKLLTEVLAKLSVLDEKSDAATAQREQIILRIETQLLSQGSKKAVRKKPESKTKKNDATAPATSKTYSNTMYWYAAMYASGDGIIKGTYTADEEKKASASCDSVKHKSEYDKKKALGFAIWKSFTPDKRQNALKTKFTNWKKALDKKQAENVTPEEHTD
jgi:hypothetical protein